MPAYQGSDNSELYEWLWQLGKHSALCLKDTRTREKDVNKEVWLALEQTPKYQG